MTGGALALPSPERVRFAQIRELLPQIAQLRHQCEDRDAADELRRRIAAYAKYVGDAEARKLLDGQMHLTAMLVVELTPAPKAGRPPNGKSPNSVTSGIPQQREAEYRLLLKHRTETEALLEAGRSLNVAVREATRLDRQAKAKAVTGLSVIPKRFQDVDPAGLGRVDVILTDPPYSAEAVEEYEELSEWAARTLREGGSAFVMVGQAHLPRALELLTRSLRYHWTLAYLTPGAKSPTAPMARQVNSFWKPVVWLVNGDYDGAVIGDVARSDANANEKDLHGWGQTESGVADLVRRCSREGDVVLDPYCGSGTTGVAALALGRRFIGIEADAETAAVADGRLAA